MTDPENGGPADRPAETGQRYSDPATPLGVALAPLRDRYLQWLQLDADEVLADRDEAAQDIRAMQIVLRMERADPPSWHRALAGAATAAAAICLDVRSQPGGEWYDAIRDYCRGHIRKVTRRARGAHWAAAQELPGITVDIDGTQLRALVPGLVTQLDPRISRLQVGGTDVGVDEALPEQITATALDGVALPGGFDDAREGDGTGRARRHDRRGAVVGRSTRPAQLA